MEMPKPMAEHKKLELLAGEWSGEETMHPSPWDPKGAKVTSRGTSRMALDGFFLLTDYEQTRDGKISYRGHGVMGYDQRLAKYTMWWFDGMGVDPGSAALGTWNGDTLTFERKHHMGHSRYTYVFHADGTYAFKIEMSQDGQNWMTFLDGTYRRT